MIQSINGNLAILLCSQRSIAVAAWMQRRNSRKYRFKLDACRWDMLGNRLQP